MGRILPWRCNMPGPGDSHCTNDRGHDWSCYDMGEDVSFNDRHDFRHDCDDPQCDNQHFTNEGD